MCPSFMVLVTLSGSSSVTSSGTFLCGSRFLSDAKSRHALIELECLAVVGAVKKCGLFLHGSLFDIVTDHCPLVPILNHYSLDQIENPRLQRLVLKLRPFQLHATWCKGTDNPFADAAITHA